jgi:hypothetical protein
MKQEKSNIKYMKCPPRSVSLLNTEGRQERFFCPAHLPCHETAGTVNVPLKLILAS